MDLLYAEILGVCFVFFGLILFSIVPYFLVRFCNKRRPSADDDGGTNDFTPVKKRQHESRMKRLLVGLLGLPWFSLLNCFAAGVFMATCFIGLVPHVRDHVTIYQRYGTHAKDSNRTSSSVAEGHSHSLKGREPWAEFLLVVGFLSVMLLEELISIFQDLCCVKKKKDKDKADIADKHAQLSLHCQQNGVSSTKTDKFHNQTAWRTSPDEVNEVYPLMDIVTLKDDNSSDSYGSRRSPTSSMQKLQRRDEKPLVYTAHSDHHDQMHNHSGHHHHHSVDAVFSIDSHSLTWRSVALLLSLSVHGVFEGVALGLQDNSETFLRLLTGVMTHEILCAAAFGINLAGHRVKIGSAILSSLLLAVTVPGGMLTGLAIRRSGVSNGNTRSELMIKIILEGFAAGTFVYVAFFDMLAHEMLEKKFKLLKILFVFTGFLTFFFVTLSL